MYHIIQTLLLNPHEPRWKPVIHQETPSAKVHLQSLHALFNKSKNKKFFSQKCIKSVRATVSVLSFVPLWVTTEMMSKILKISYPNIAFKKKKKEKTPPVPTVYSDNCWQNRIIISGFQMQTDWSHTHWQDSWCTMYFYPAARAALPPCTITQAPVHLPSCKHKKCVDSSQSNRKLWFPWQRGIAVQVTNNCSFQNKYGHTHQHTGNREGRSSATPQWVARRCSRPCNALCVNRIRKIPSKRSCFLPPTDAEVDNPHSR